MEHCNKMIEERPVVFKNKRGQKLFGVLHLPLKNYCLPIVIMAHGFTDDKTGDNRLFVKFARCAAEAGIAILRFDFAGSGDSEGDFSQMTVDTEVGDLHSAVDFVYTLPEVDKTRINLIGYSLGGAISIILAANDLRVKSFIGWAPVSFLLATFRRILGRRILSLSKKNDSVFCSNGSKQFFLGRDFFNSIEKYDLIREINNISPRPILLIQGSLDKKVFPKNTEAIFKNAKEPKKMHLIKGSSHSFAFFESQLIDITLQNLLEWNFKNRQNTDRNNMKEKTSNNCLVYL